MTQDALLDRPAAPIQSDMVIQARGLTRYFGRRCVVDSLSLDVPRGSVFAFIGRNGAGKSTTIRMLLGLLTPTRGQSAILGCPSTELTPGHRARIGYMAEGHPVYSWMRVREYGVFQKSFYPRWKQATFDSVIDYFAIQVTTKCGDLSHGQRAGLHLASTLAIEPELLVLDDPATGLDPAARRSLLEAMIAFTRGRERTIFFSTHLLDEVERIADHVAILDYSVLRACCPIDVFQERVQQFAVHFPESPPQKIPEIPGLLRMTQRNHTLDLILINHNGRTERVLETLGADSVEEVPLSLEDALTAYVARQGVKNLISTLGDA